MESRKKEIAAFVGDYFRAYFTERDYAKVVSFLSPDITVIGTGFDEVGRTARESLRLYRLDMEEVSEPVRYSKLEINVQVETPHYCVVSGELAINGEADGIAFAIDPLRYSMLISTEGDRFLIVHHHISTPNDMQEEGEMYPLQKLIKQNETLNEAVEERTRRLVEANQRLSESNRTKETLFSLVAHDIKAPFNSLLGFVDILQNQYDEFDAAQHKKYIRHISESSHRIFNLADNLLIWAKLQQDMFDPDFEPIPLRKIIQESADVYESMWKSKGIAFGNRVDPSRKVLSDEFMISTIFRNLLSNAIKYCHQDGSVEVYEVNSGSRSGDEITVCVEDTGIGIHEKRLQELFHSKINASTDGTGREKGSGLGLVLCKEFMDLHRSRIWAESEEGHGSRFYLTFKTF
ncbi:MAG: ATP-binding protein [Bacteroidales bacterium]